MGSTAEFVDADHSLVRFYIPENARWPNIARQTTNLGKYLTDAVCAVAKENPELSGSTLFRVKMGRPVRGMLRNCSLIHPERVWGC